MLAALAHGVTIVPGRSDFRWPWAVVDADWTRSQTVEVPRAASCVRLAFATPLRIGPRRALGGRWPDLIVSLAMGLHDSPAGRDCTLIPNPASGGGMLGS